MQTSVAAPNAKSRRKPEPVCQRSIVTYFPTECSVCGRRLRVLVEHLGQVVACGHCGRSFVATDPASNSHAAQSTLEKANQLLVRCSTMRSA